MKESQVEQKLVRLVKARGGLSYKFTSPGNIGVPDRIVIKPNGEVWFVELKTETGRLSRMQEYQLNRLREHGCNAVVLYGPEEVENKINAIFKQKEGGDPG